MKAKNLVTVGLLLFVAASVATLAAKALRRGTPPAPDGPAPAEAADAPAPAPLAGGVTAYYFHSNTRCPTCQTIEKYAQEAIESGFADELRDGGLAWHVVNYETPGNEHFAKDYEVIAPTVVLVKTGDDGEEKWSNLMRVWELVGEKDAFIEYVQAEARAMLDGA